MVRLAHTKIEKDFHQDLSAKKLSTFLTRAALPKTYPNFTEKKRFECRMRVLHSWYDPKMPHVLIDNVDRYLAAHFLFVEYYLKTENPGIYYFQDPCFKYDMLRLVMGPSLSPNQPSRTIVTAPRRVGKTQTLIVECCLVLLLNRPYTTILMSQVNDTRTKEEISKVMIQVEDNARIVTDYGEEGELFVKRQTKTPWNSNHLSFIHLPETRLLGHSLESAQRGRGPIFGIIDDPEDEETSYNAEWRRKFFLKLFKVYSPMFPWGGKFVWIGTPIHKSSCLQLGIKGKSQQESEGDMGKRDERFDDFKKGKFPAAWKDREGNWQSAQPDRWPPGVIEEGMRINPHATAAELLCEPTSPGSRYFSISAETHGYMHCVDSDGEYMLDLFTGERFEWKRWLKGLRVFSAGDLASGASAESDFCALVFLGVDAQGITFILDVFNQQCEPSHLVEMSCLLGELWECEQTAWEEAGLLVIINKLLRPIYEDMQAKGVVPPVPVRLDNAKKNKVRRILSMAPLFGRNQIRFLSFQEFTDVAGTVHTALPNPRLMHYEELLAQIKDYTGLGIDGHDDAIDSLEMALRISSGVRGDLIQDEKPSLQGTLEKWKDVGMSFDHRSLPKETWTDEMHKEAMALPSEPAFLEPVPYL